MKYLILCTILALSGCSKIQNYELESIIEQCGGLQKVRTVWLDLTMVKARCTNGKMVIASYNVGNITT